ncbi:MAG: hypothetical protein HYU84_09025, partial [Chloroflexi bacterium]|nr:hypothetical protein [Chloroflexota bacterium]
MTKSSSRVRLNLDFTTACALPYALSKPRRLTRWSRPRPNQALTELKRRE